MLDYPCCCQIKHLQAHQGGNASQIAKELGRDPRPVASWLAQDHCRPRTPRPHASKRDPCTAQIARLLER